ncbi:MAG: hypothetical protein DCC49_12515 [Acidobacteria bacterium]|nr:MAG: hypothetical protein DCC49_12515 [Acidobacteriota bacterium]
MDIFLIGLAAVIFLTVVMSIHKIGETQVGLVTKRLSFKKLREDNVIAMNGEAGFQADLLMPGLRWKFWPVYKIHKHPWVQVPAGEIGVVISQVGASLPIGAKSATYRNEFGNFSDLKAFLAAGGQKGVQRPVLPPGTLVPMHPVGFMVITAAKVYGVPVSPEFRKLAEDGHLLPQSFGLSPDQLRVVVIAPQGEQDMIGIVTALEGEPLPSGDIASRLGGFADIADLEANQAHDAQIMEILLGSKNTLHNNYQDYQAFLEAGGKIGLQHDPLLYGAYLLNPFLVRVEMVPMLVVRQGEVAVVKAFVGLPTLDTSGAEFKFGSIVRPGHRGIWQEPLRTGKYPINPRVYASEIVPTSILTLNWASTSSTAHNLDAHLSSIMGKSREGFVFTIDLQVQIHVPDTRAPKVISMVGTMMNLVNEVLQSAVGNHFRNTLQSLEAVRFIETREEVQLAAVDAIRGYLSAYEVETKGVYIQDVIFPEELVEVLTRREIANQEKATFLEQQRAQMARVDMENAKGTADMQAQLAQAEVSVSIRRNEADAREQEARGVATYTVQTGEAEATRVQAIGLAEAKAVEALGLAKAEGYEAQKDAIGPGATAMVAVAGAIADGKIDIMPEVLVTGGNGGGAFEGLAATAMNYLVNNGAISRDESSEDDGEGADAGREAIGAGAANDTASAASGSS